MTVVDRHRQIAFDAGSKWIISSKEYFLITGSVDALVMFFKPQSLQRTQDNTVTQEGPSIQ